MTDIEKIYDLFAWDDSYDPEEISSRIEEGMNLARQVKDLSVFLQPSLPDGISESLWDSCARVIAERQDAELVPYLDRLFDWLHDGNWPGEGVILERLSAMPEALTEEAYENSRQRAEKAGDEMWISQLDDFKSLQSERDSF